jgi:GrpB-like predicted nucleotidyltransferase (UPF0157 family)
MTCIGEQRLNPAHDDHSLIASMFDRLPREVQHAGNLIRFVGYQSSGGGPDCLRFFGIETETGIRIPAGLLAWELEQTSWRVRQPTMGREAIVWQEDIHWMWKAKPQSADRASVGEFLAHGAPQWWADGSRKKRRFTVFANAYLDRRKSATPDEVRITDYDPSWPDRFDSMAGWLQDSLGPEIALSIEHYGSTSIPDMPAKPIIDIAVRIPSFEKGRKRALTVLSDETWEYWWYADHMVFIKRKEVMGERTHHVHMAPDGHDLWKGLAFRDHLRSHSDDAGRYASLKRRLAASHGNDRERYTMMKTEFVEEILRKTRRSR